MPCKVFVLDVFDLVLRQPSASPRKRDFKLIANPHIATQSTLRYGPARWTRSSAG